MTNLTTPFVKVGSKHADSLLEDRVSCQSARQLLSLTKEQRAVIVRRQANEASKEYEDDLALPIDARELTAFTAIDCVPFLDSTHA